MHQEESRRTRMRRTCASFIIRSSIVKYDALNGRRRTFLQHHMVRREEVQYGDGDVPCIRGHDDIRAAVKDAQWNERH